MITEEKKKKAVPEEEAWNPVKAGENRSNGSSTTRTEVTGDTSGWNEPAEYDFKAPEKKEYKYNPDEGLWSMFGPKEPEYDAGREERLKRLARVNAFGDFVKHLGAFAGGGYAPVERRGENKPVLSAFQDLDRMREVYDAKQDQYNDKKLSLRMQDDANQRVRHERDYERDYNLAVKKYDTDYAQGEAVRKNKESAYWQGNLSQVNEQNGRTEQFQNKDLLLAELEGKKRTAGGGGTDESFTVYKQGVGDLKVSKDATIQIGTRIKDAMLRAGKISEKDAAGLMAALAGPGSRTTFQAMLDNMKYADVWEECKPFLGHGLELVKPEKPKSGPGSEAGSSGSGANNTERDVTDVSDFFEIDK